MKVLTMKMIPILGFLCLALSAHGASLVLSLTNANLSGLPGSTMTFNGTLLNNGIDEVFLNGDAFGLSSLELTLNDTAFLFSAPVSLSPGASYTGALFDVQISPLISPGQYFGFFTVLGGSDSFTFESLASADFSVTLTPEPATGLMLLLGLLSICVGRSTSKHATNKTVGK